MIFSLIFIIFFTPSLVLASDMYISSATALKDTFLLIGKRFESIYGMKINFHFGPSGSLKTQIDKGAPVDIFASAGLKEIEELIKTGRVEKNVSKVFAKNSLVIAGNKNIKPMESIKELANFRKIAVPNPKTSPLGRYTDEVLNHYNLKKELLEKIIYVENVRQAADYIVRGEVEAAFLYMSEFYQNRNKLNLLLKVDTNSHSPIVFAIAIIKDSKNKEMAQKYIDFLMSQEGKNILTSTGFNLP